MQLHVNVIMNVNGARQTCLAACREDKDQRLFK